MKGNKECNLTQINANNISSDKNCCIKVSALQWSTYLPYSYCQEQSVDFVRFSVTFYFNTDSLIFITFMVFLKMICTFFFLYLRIGYVKFCRISCLIFSEMILSSLSNRNHLSSHNFCLSFGPVFVD